jgi:hypothetical protein
MIVRFGIFKKKSFVDVGANFLFQSASGQHPTQNLLHYIFVKKMIKDIILIIFE